MEITIPSAVRFYTVVERAPVPELVGDKFPFHIELCFMHAVKAALKSYKIQSDLVEYAYPCDVCRLSSTFHVNPEKKELLESMQL